MRWRTDSSDCARARNQCSGVLTHTDRRGIMRPRRIAALARLYGRPAAQDPARPAADRTRTLGQSMVEFALILPVMLLLVAAAVDLGRLFFAYVAVENAAKEGVLYGARHPLCADASNINCAANGAN